MDEHRLALERGDEACVAWSTLLPQLLKRGAFPAHVPEHQRSRRLRAELIDKRAAGEARRDGGVDEAAPRAAVRAFGFAPEQLTKRACVWWRARWSQRPSIDGVVKRPVPELERHLSLRQAHANALPARFPLWLAPACVAAAGYGRGHAYLCTFEEGGDARADELAGAIEVCMLERSPD